MFLGWFDDTPKKNVEQKLEEAMQHYLSKFGETPNICLVNSADATHYEGLEVRVADYVRPNHFWVGRGEWPMADVSQAA